MSIISPAFAQQAASANQPGIEGFLPIILIFIVFYFLVIRPVSKKNKEHQEMVNSVKRNDKVITAGGIVGKVTKVIEDENIVEVEIAPDVKVKVSKPTLANIIPPSEKEPKKKKNG